MKKRRHIFFTIPLIGLLCCTVLFLLLPFICDRFLLPRLLNNLPFSEKEFSLSKISPWLVRGTLTLAEDGRPTVAIPRFELHSSPGGLLRGKITRLLIDSASLEIDISGDTPVIHGLPFLYSSQQQQGSPFLPPVVVESIVVKNVSLILNKGNNDPIRLTLDSSLEIDYSNLQNAGKQPIAITGRLQLKGDLNTKAAIILTREDVGFHIDIQAEVREISQLRPLFPAIQQLNLTGALSLTTVANIDAQGNFTNHRTTAHLSRFRLAKDTLIIENDQSEQPLTLELSGDMVENHYTLTNAAFSKPENIMFGLHGQFETGNGNFSGEGTFLPRLTNSPIKITYLGQSNASGTRLEYQLKSEKMNIGDNLQLSPLEANGVIHTSNATTSGTFNSRMKSIKLPASNLKLEDVALQLPFSFPEKDDTKATPGFLSIDSINYRDVASAELQATLSSTADSIAFTSQLRTPFASELLLSCEGVINLVPELTLDCLLPEIFIDESALPPFVEIDENFTFNGKVSADLHLRQDTTNMAGRLKISIHEGSASNGPNSLTDINIDVVFPTLPLRQSEPNQLCTIGQAEFGSIRMTDGRIRFRIEDEKTIFLEKSRFNWCGGRVETTSFAVSTEMKELEATLFCDRLKFTELLTQFGIEGAEGDGSLNGRLPLFISPEGVVFDDGFLFSTPGNSGIVRFNNTAQLRQGIPSIDQSAYLDYSMQALENFSYNWTKLTFNSELDQLLISMQLDGKPAEPLPFGYKNGTIVPTDKGPGIDHPIRLDVNFRLPLQEMFKYGKNIQSIMEKM
ncbi:MAG: intermembrane phospholipid transport protein YdbH family protein [Desulforhopalus sp.]